MFSINLHNCASHSPDVPGRAESQELSDPKRFTIVSEDISMRWKSMVLLFVASTLFLVAGTVIAQERSAQVVFTPSTPTFSFGMIGLGTGASARLNVVNLVRTAPGILIPQVPCKVELDLYDGQGKLIKQKTVAGQQHCSSRHQDGRPHAGRRLCRYR